MVYQSCKQTIELVNYKFTEGYVMCLAIILFAIHTKEIFQIALTN